MSAKQPRRSGAESVGVRNISPDHSGLGTHRRARRGEAARLANWLAAALPEDLGTGCLYWPFGRSGVGYPQVRLGTDVVAVHRFVCRSRHGQPAPGMLATHCCGNGRFGCVHPGHLRWGSYLENAHDRVMHARLGRGPHHCGCEDETEAAA